MEYRGKVTIYFYQKRSVDKLLIKRLHGMLCSCGYGVPFGCPEKPEKPDHNESQTKSQ